MIYAIIDLGTNTFNLLIAQVQGARFNKIFGTKEVVKLGEGGITRNYISEIPFQRGLEALCRHHEKIEEFKADKIFAFATSAIRDAENGLKFSAEVLKKTGITVNTISGEKEAELIYYGVKQAIDLGDDLALIMDIGGGSTEFIIANNEKIFWKKSFQLGVSRLLEKFKPSDPVKKEEIQQIENYFEEEMHSLFNAVASFPVARLVGSSGSFDSFADMVAEKFYSKKILKGKTGYDFNIKDLAFIHRKIVKSCLAERLKMKGLVPFRADNIVLSSILTQFVIKKIDVRKIQLSKYALKEGVLWAILNEVKI